MSARRGRRHPLGAHAGAVSASLRLHCGARSGVASQNSLCSLRSLRSNSCAESDNEARCAPPLLICPPRRPKSPQRMPPAALCHGLFFSIAKPDVPAKARAGRPSRRALRGAEKPLARGRARSALRGLTRRNCPNAANEVSVVSSATGHETEHRRGVGAQRRPPRRSAAAACPPVPLPHQPFRTMAITSRPKPTACQRQSTSISAETPPAARHPAPARPACGPRSAPATR